MNVMPLQATLTSYFSFPTISNDNMAHVRTCEAVATHKKEKRFLRQEVNLSLYFFFFAQTVKSRNNIIFWDMTPCILL
jgi:hypothetical protein